jgi:hypothetical protein
MLPGSFLYCLGILAATVLIAGAGAVYWFAICPLPKTSGSITALIAERATVVRDALGVPHIAAGSIADAPFDTGFAVDENSEHKPSPPPIPSCRITPEPETPRLC